MSITTYAELQTEIANHLARDDLTSEIPTFIQLAEEMHRALPADGGIRIQAMMNRDAITVNARQVAFPTGMLEVIDFRLLTDPVTPLDYVTQSRMTQIRNSNSGKPEFYTIGPDFEFNKAPDSSYSGEIIYYKAETALSVSNTSNNILANHPGCYLYGALLATAPFLMEDPRIATWQTLYSNFANMANGQNKRLRRTSNAVSRVRGDTP